MSQNKQPQFSQGPHKPLPAKSTTPPLRAIRAIRIGNNKYRIVEEEYAGPPTTAKTIKDNLDRVSAEYEVRLWNEDVNLGPQRFGQSGLDQ